MASDQWDALELEVEAAAARLRAPSVEYDDLLGSDLDDEALERATAEVDAKGRGVAAAELLFFRALSEWATALPQVDHLCAAQMIEWLQKSMTSYVEFCEAWETGEVESAWLYAPDVADTQWGFFKSSAEIVAISRRRRG